MIVTTYADSLPQTTVCRESALVSLDYAELNPRGGHGIELARIHVLNGDKRAVFWVLARDNGHGRVTLEVSTARRDGTTRKSVTGNWEPRR